MYWIIGALALALWAFWAALSQILATVGFSFQIEKLGQWGDSFGALNTMFSGFAFLAVVFTIRQQQNQINAAQQQNQKERFDTAFFELLSLLRESRNEVRFKYSREIRDEYEVKDGTATGREAFRNAWFEIDHLIADPQVTSDQVARLYEERIHNRFEASLGPYFRVLYTILRRIRSDASLSDDERIQYGNLLRSQLSSNEVTVLALNGISSVSNDLRRLIVEFRMLKYLPSTQNRRGIMMRHYPKETFEARD